MTPRDDQTVTHPPRKSRLHGHVIPSDRESAVSRDRSSAMRFFPLGECSRTKRRSSNFVALYPSCRVPDNSEIVVEARRRERRAASLRSRILGERRIRAPYAINSSGLVASHVCTIYTASRVFGRTTGCTVYAGLPFPLSPIMDQQPRGSSDPQLPPSLSSSHLRSSPFSFSPSLASPVRLDVTHVRVGLFDHHQLTPLIDRVVNDLSIVTILRNLLVIYSGICIAARIRDLSRSRRRFRKILVLLSSSFSSHLLPPYEVLP